MSYASEVRAELSAQNETTGHCREAALMALLLCLSKITLADEDTVIVTFQSDEDVLATKCFTLLEKTLNIKIVSNRNELFLSREQWSQLPWFVFLMNADTENGTVPEVIQGVLSKDCCRRSFLRNAFLAAGTVSDPDKGYHLEFNLARQDAAEAISYILLQYEIHSKMIRRRKNYTVYLKDSEEIIDTLSLMGAHAGLMRMENSRILKEVRNSINRRVNCEAANIGKTVAAARRQVEDIEFLQRSGAFSDLPDNLVEIAQLRLENEDMPLAELGKLAHPPLGKSGVNHRLRKLSELAEKTRSTRFGKETQ
ncbi:MAG: DNA-binding protein WhiA [Lachnospiraceae bacterium]|nr:DNA-binding protein WhiA [Lachnospiraceae bacterium]